MESRLRRNFMSRVSLGAAVLIFLIWTALGDAQTITIQQSLPPPPPPPPVGGPARDLPMRTGSSQIRGRVIDATTGSPLRRAIVRASSPAAGPPRTTMTDADGRYEIRNLPAGANIVNASRTN